MPLDPLKYSDPIVRVYEACVDELLVNLAKHFSLDSIDQTGSWDYEVMMLSKLGAIRKETAAIIAKRVANNEPMIEEAVRTAMLDALEDVEPELRKAAKAGMLHSAEMDVMDGIQIKLSAYSRQARNQLNLVNTVMLESTAAAYRKGVYAAVDIVKQLETAQDVLNIQTGKVITGVATPQQALRAAVKAMADVGITGFVDHAGRNWSAEAYVRMAIKTTVSNSANAAVMARNEQYGNDIVWPRVNATARPGCYPWQGQLISMSNMERDVPDGNGKMRHVYPASKTTYGQPDGIWGINCHHGPMNVFIPGFSYVRGEDVKPDQEKNDRLYQLTQEQRRLERKVRYAKRDAAMYDAAGDKEAADLAKNKMRTNQQKLKELVETSNGALYRDRSREWVNTGSPAVVDSVITGVSEAIPKSGKLHEVMSEGTFAQYTDIIDNAPEPVQKLHDKYHEYVYIADSESKEHPHFAYGEGVKIDIQKAMSKDNGYVLHHEIGHNIDNAAHLANTFNKEKGKAARDPRSSYSFVYKNNKFGKTLNADAEKALERYSTSLAERYASATEKAKLAYAKEWKSLGTKNFMKLMGFDEAEIEMEYAAGLSAFIRKELLNSGLSVQLPSTRKELEESFSSHINSTVPWEARSAISDMFEATFKYVHHPFGAGHGLAYWKQEEYMQPMEAFAEMYSTSISHPDQWEQIEKYFPNAVNVFWEMLEGIT